MKHTFWRVLTSFSLIFAVILTAVLATPSPVRAGGPGPDAVCDIDPNFQVYIWFFEPNEAYYIPVANVTTTGQTLGVRSLQGQVIFGPQTLNLYGGYPAETGTVNNQLTPDVLEKGVYWSSTSSGTYNTYFEAFFDPAQTDHVLWISYLFGDQSGTWTYTGCDLVDVWPQPTPTPTPSATPTATPSASPSATPTATPSVSPTATPSASPSASPSTTPSASPSDSPSPSPSDSPSPSPSDNPSPSPSDSPSPSASPTNSPTPTPTPSPSDSPSPSATPIASGVVIDPENLTLGLNCTSVTMTANLLDQNGQPITTGITQIDWGMSSTNSVGTLENITGNQANFKPLNNGTGNVTVTIWYQGQSYTGSIAVNVTDSANCNSNNNNNNSNNSNNNSAGSAPQCTDSKPGSAPILNGASVTGDNEVTLYWSKANDPVTYYLITYGNKPGEQSYGNPNVGDKNTTQYTVKQLSGGKTYYFKVRAGNNCMPGDFSNEVSVYVPGRELSVSAEGFGAGILGESTEEASPTPTPQASSEATASATPAAEPEVKGTTSGTCQDPVWKIWLLIANVFLMGLALVVGLKERKYWYALVVPTAVISLSLVWAAFCAKLMWVLVYAGIYVMSYVLKKMSEVEV